MDADLGTATATADAHGPADAIAGFRDARNSRRRKTFHTIFACGILLNIFSMFGAHVFGLDLWSWFYATAALSTSLMFVPPYNWEVEYANMSLRRPGVALLLCVGWHAYGLRVYLNNDGKYGLLNSLRYLYHVYLFVTGFPSLCRGDSPFAQSVDPNISIGRRRGTATEAMLMDMCICNIQYTILPVLLLCDGQYEHGILGHLGGVLQVVLQLVLLALYMRHYGCKVTGQNSEPPGTTRIDLHGETYYIAMAFLGVHFFMLALLGPPAEVGGTRAYLEPGAFFQGDLLLDSYGSQTAPGTSPANNEILGLQGVISLTVYIFRPTIYGVFYRVLENKQRLIDGAFIAELLEETGQSESVSGEQFGDLIAESASLVRRVSIRNLSIRVLASSPRDVAGKRGMMKPEESYALGESCGLGGIDYFVSHSWSDCHRQKFAQLAAVALMFYRKHRRPCNFWLDKVCINQSSIERDLRCLPIFVSSCDNLLILAGESYATRLCTCYAPSCQLQVRFDDCVSLDMDPLYSGCVFELYIHFAMSGVDAAKRTQIANCTRAVSEGSVTTSSDNFSESGAASKTTESTGSNALATFDIALAHCFSETDEAKLRRIIEVR